MEFVVLAVVESRSAILPTPRVRMDLLRYVHDAMPMFSTTLLPRSMRSGRPLSLALKRKDQNLSGSGRIRSRLSSNWSAVGSCWCPSPCGVASRSSQHCTPLQGHLQGMQKLQILRGAQQAENVACAAIENKKPLGVHAGVSCGRSQVIGWSGRMGTLNGSVYRL
jgi:hypothetical protein